MVAPTASRLINPTDPRDCDALDLRAVWRAMPSYGPSWDAAIELGIDIVQFEYNLSLTPTERLLQHHEMAQTFERLHGVALAEHA